MASLAQPRLVSFFVGVHLSHSKLQILGPRPLTTKIEVFWMLPLMLERMARSLAISFVRVTIFAILFIHLECAISSSLLLRILAYNFYQ